jgi:hypothetical protein
MYYYCVLTLGDLSKKNPKIALGVTVSRRLQCIVNFTRHCVYKASRWPAQHSAAIDHHHWAEVIIVHNLQSLKVESGRGQ